MTGVVCVGAQWGDEGKGKIVDLLAERADVVVRFQGGNNAGHTLVVGGVQTVLHLIPSGVLHPGKLCVIANGVVVDPDVLLSEVETLQARGHLKDPSRLAVSHQAHVILDIHKRIDLAREKYLPRKIGTTGRGIGPAYEDKAARRGLRVLDLMKKETWADLLRARVSGANTYLAGLGAPPVSGAELEEMIEKTRRTADALRPFVRDTVVLLDEQRRAGKHILFEGAQGTLLDVDHGTYPYVTSSNTVSGAACAGAGVGPTAIQRVIGVCKAYATRVGEGPFPTELHDEIGERLRGRGLEFGATTGRPRRCGWLDMVSLRRAVRLNGVDCLAVTKLDILSGLKPLKVAVAYEVDGKRVEEYPADTEELARAKPVYIDMPGFDGDVTGARRLEDLPPNARAYVEWIARELGVKLALVSVGAGRGEEIALDPVF
ncbi:MAG: adenylosuccinate synthase [Myxococcota bacterium]